MLPGLMRMMLTIVGRLANDVYRLVNITKCLEMKFCVCITSKVTWFGFGVANSALWLITGNLLFLCGKLCFALVVTFIVPRVA